MIATSLLLKMSLQHFSRSSRTRGNAAGKAAGVSLVIREVQAAIPRTSALQGGLAMVRALSSRYFFCAHSRDETTFAVGKGQNIRY